MNKRITCPVKTIATYIAVADTLGLNIAPFDWGGDGFVSFDIAKDEEYRYCAVRNIPKDYEFLRSAIWCSIAHYSFIAKHPKLARSSVFRDAIIFWIKSRYYPFNKRPDVDFEILARGVFPVLFADGETKIMSDIFISDSDNHRNRFFGKFSALMRVMVNGPVKRGKIALKNACHDRLKLFVVQKSSPEQYLQDVNQE